MSIFALAPFAGPSIGPIVAGFIEVSGTVSQTIFCHPLTDICRIGVGCTGSLPSLRESVSS